MRSFLLALLLMQCYMLKVEASARDMSYLGSRIVGGSDAMPGELPYVVSVMDNTTGWPVHHCGGAIYTDTWIITAAQCVQGFDLSPEKLQVAAGETTHNVDEFTEQIIHVVEVIIHESFNSLRLVNDIALLRLASPLHFNGNVQIISLPGENQTVTGECTVSGWGSKSEGGGVSQILQKATVPIVRDQDCRQSYGATEIVDSQICAGDLDNGGVDACAGDAGGPLACIRGTVLAGIASWGFGCARPNYPGVYTEVAYFVDWIEENTY